MSADQLKVDQDIKINISNSGQNSKANQPEQKKAMNEPVQMKSKLSQTRQIISARQIQKLSKDDNPVFLAIVRQTSETPQKRGNKRSSNRVANFASAHGMTEGAKRKINTETGPKKHIISVAEREQQVLDSFPENHRKYLEKLIKEYPDIFPEKLPKGVPPLREV